MIARYVIDIAIPLDQLWPLWNERRSPTARRTAPAVRRADLAIH